MACTAPLPFIMTAERRSGRLPGGELVHTQIKIVSEISNLATSQLLLVNTRSGWCYKLRRITGCAGRWLERLS
jgi:hypothetical protein